MKLCTVLMVLISGALTAEIYTTKFGDFDIDIVLKNNRILTNYIKCMMGEVSCTKEGRELKRILPVALASDCIKCDPMQKKIGIKVINHLKEKRPRDWERLLAKYDPQGEYKKRFDAAHATTILQY